MNCEISSQEPKELITPVQVAGLRCANRSVRSATATGTCDLKTGVPGPKFFEVYESLARGRPGLLIMEHCFVALRGHAGHRQLGIHSDEMLQYHEKVVRLIKKANPASVVCCQLAHAGPNGGQPDKFNFETATAKDFEEAVQQFAQAAVRAQRAGYDCVQIHAGHTFLLSQSLSSFYNKRGDQYGAQDCKLLRDTLQAVKAAVQIPVGVKLQFDDYLQGHTMHPERACQLLEQLSFAFVEITGGGFGAPASKVTIRPGWSEQYYYKHVVQMLKTRGLLQKQPVIVTGGFQSVKQAAEALEDGAALVGFARKWLRNDQFLVGPDDKDCGHCNDCISGLVAGGEGLCSSVQREQAK